MSFMVKNLLLVGLFLVYSIFINKKMRTGLTSGEVVGFEFSGFKEKTASIVTEWQTAPSKTELNKLEALRKNTHFDFLYIVGYVFLGIFIARLAAGEVRVNAANTVYILILVAGLCDVVENLQILQIIKGNFGLRPMVMSVCAAVKFGLLAVSLGWSVVLVVAQFIGQTE